MPAIALPDPPLSDGTVTLRGFDPSDASAPTAACRDPEIPRWTLGPSPHTEAHARESSWAFGSLGLTRIDIRTQIANRAAQAVARRARVSPVLAPLVRRPESEHLPDIFFARLRG